MKQILVVFGCLLSLLSSNAQNNLAGNYRAVLVRQDKNTVIFNMQVATENGEPVIYIINAEEKIRISPVAINNDSVNFSMPVTIPCK